MYSPEYRHHSQTARPSSGEKFFSPAPVGKIQREQELSKQQPAPNAADKKKKERDDLFKEIYGKCYGQTSIGNACFDNDPLILKQVLRGFSTREERLLSLVKTHATMMLNRALLAVDAGDINISRLLQSIMEREDVKFSEVREKIVLVRNALQKMKFQAVTCADETCNRRNTIAFVCRGETELVHICDNFFEKYDRNKGWKNRNATEMEITLVHEAGHLAGIRSPLVKGDEFYCSKRDGCYQPCEVPDPMNNVDALAYLFQCISNQF